MQKTVYPERIIESDQGYYIANIIIKTEKDVMYRRQSKYFASKYEAIEELLEWVEWDVREL